MKDFTRGRIGRQIIAFSLPIILGNLFMQLYQVINSVIVGRYLGKEALAAVGASTPVIFAVIALVIGIGVGSSVVISQYFGVKQYDKVRITADTLHIFLLGAGVLIAIGGFLFSRDIFYLTNLPEELIPQATHYLTIYLGGIILLFGFNTITSMLRGVGDSRTPLLFLAISAVMNIGLDLLFIVSFGWGIPGAAWATLISQGCAYFLAILYVNHRHELFRINFLNMRFDTKIFKQCVNYGLPTGVQQSFVAISGLILMAVINPFGATVIAGYTIAMRIDAMAMIPSMNFAMGLTSFVGQNIGAKRMDRVKKGLNLTLLYSSLVCVVITVSIIIFGHDIMSIFTPDKEIIDIGMEYLVIVTSFYLVFNIMFAFNGLFRGAGAVIVPMLSTFISLWLVRLPIAYWLSGIMGSKGIWWSIPFGWVVGMAIVLIYYKSGKWKNHSIFNRNKPSND